MVIKKLIDEFVNSPIGQNTVFRLSSNNFQETYLYGLTDAAKGFFLTSLNSIIKRPIVFLAYDTNSALSLYNEILNLTNTPVFYFPSQEVSPYDQIASDPEIIGHQAKTLLHLTNLKDKKESCLIITTAKCLLEKVWNKNELIKHSFSLKLHAQIQVQDLAKRLVEIGYRKTQVVTNKGEFSVRGNIFDVFPVTSESTRIELFDDEIESIKTFSTATQRSQNYINEVVISPRYYIIKPDAETLIQKINIISSQKDELLEVRKKEIEEIKINTYPESIEYYSQLVNQSTSSLFDYLREDTLFIIDDWEANAISLESWQSRNLEIKNELQKDCKIIPLLKPLLLDVETVIKEIKKHSLVYIERFDVFNAAPDEKSKSFNSINLLLSPSCHFQNQIEKFANQVQEWVSTENKIIIFSDQPQRIRGILKEWNIPSIYTEDLKEEEYKLNQIFISKEGTVSGFKIDSSSIIVLTDHEIFGTKRRPTLLKKNIKSTKYEYYSNIEDLKPNDYVVHIKHGIGRYKGLVKITIDNTEREYLMIEYASDGKLYLPVEQINLLYRYRGSVDVIPKLSKLGGADWELTKKKVKKAVKRIAEDLLNLYTARSKLEGFAFNLDSHWQIEMEEAFPYIETPDQWKAIQEVKADMESTKPMDRLICGDVGYGKTEVAIRGIFKAVLSSKQVAVLVPTTILAEQHYNVILERLAPYPVRIAVLSRFISSSEQKRIIAKLALGEIDIVIGTHRLLQKDVDFKNLGLVVIDEEQRFGVLHKETLKQLRVTVDVITLSATPIPRTLHMALSGARDMSLINTPPANRLPIKTFVGEFKSTIVKTAILHELERNGQVYFVHNRVETIKKVGAYLKELIPEANIAIAHGQMQDKELENVMFDFLQRKYNVLLCTTIIESGIDIPSVNTIIIDNADQMGLAQLYQLRGRVGRSEIQAYAYCLYAQDKVLTDTAKNRLQAIKEFSNLGSGYQIALRDMEIRGVGNILGPEQHGHMISVGFDLYCQLLNEAVDKLRGLEVQEVELETLIDLNISAFIPTTYIEDEAQKVIEYKRLANVRTYKELNYLISEWEDRFSKLPEAVENLTRIVKLRILGNKLGIKNIKSDSQFNYSIKIEVNFRLQNWLKIQSLLPKKISERTSFKSSARGTSETPSSILLKTTGLSSKEVLDILFELLQTLDSLNVNEKIA